MGSMKRVLNQLIQLQELDFALAEERASSSRMPLAKLEEAISTILATLPAEVSERFQRLRKRYPLAVVPIFHGICPSCAMALPLALVNAVRAAEQLYNCPHCGRFLYFPDVVVRQPNKRHGSERPAEVGIARFSSADLMIPKLAATTREETISELAAAMATRGFIEDAEVVTDLVLRREAIVSTAVEHGLAFPHVRDVEGGGLTFAAGLKEKGLAFGAPDGRLTKIIFLIVIPAPASAFYLRLLAGLVKTFCETDARKKFLDCETSDAMWKALTKLTRETIA
jgi:mannitol/fructose-specific phosphotransferase system IIA component (Ntr-type)